MENVISQDDQEDLLASFGGSPAQPATDSQELDSNIEVKKAVPKIMGPVDMIKETAARISEARVHNVMLKASIKKDYEQKVASGVANKEFFYGSGTEEANPSDFEE